MATYQYGGKTYSLADGLTNEAALSKIKTSLGEVSAPVADSVAPSEPSVADQVGRQLGLTARAGITGITAVPAMMSDFLTGAAGLASGKAIKPSSQALQELMTRIGLPEPQGGLERAVQAGTGAMAGTGIQAAAAQGIPALSALSANLPQQVAASAGGGVAGQAAGEAATNITGSPLAGVAAGLAVGGVGGSLAARAAGGVGQPPKIPTTIDDIKTRAGNSYRAVAEQGVALKPNSILSMLDDAQSSLVGDNFNPLLETHKPVAQVLDQMRQMVGNQPVSFTKLEQMRSAAGGLKTSNEPATRKFASDLVDQIDNYIGAIPSTAVVSGKGGIDNAVSLVQSARKDWRNMSKAQILEDALNIAETRAINPTASEQNIIRQQLISLASNKNKMRQFTESEVNAIKGVAAGGPADPLLSLLARFNPERNQMTAGSSAFAASINPYTLAVPAAGFAADKYLGYARKSAIKGLISDVAGGTVTPPLPNYSWRGMLSGLPLQQEQQ